MEKDREKIDRLAIFSSGTEMYVSPLEPDVNERVTIRCRTRKDDADGVYLITNQTKIQMQKEYSEGWFDYYNTVVQLGTGPFAYYFMITKGDQKVYFNKQGDVDDPFPQYDYRLFPGFKTPDWAKGAVMYQIYVDRFCNGNRNNNVVNDEYSYIGEHVRAVDDWAKYPITALS